MPQPTVVYVDQLDSAGCYYHSDWSPTWLDGHRIEHKGLLVLSLAEEDDRDVQAHIAHEWRHHWQLHHGHQQALVAAAVFDDGEREHGEWEAWHRYALQPVELDARRFALHKVPSYLQQYAVGLLAERLQGKPALAATLCSGGVSLS